MDSRSGYTTTTYRKQLYARHLDWMRQTKELYNEVLAFYYQILMEQKELLSLSGYELLRKLEILTIGTKETKKKGILPERPLVKFPKLPLYFRRAAANAAIGMAKSWSVRYSLWQEGVGWFRKESRCPKPATQFHAAPVYYQGMYRNWQENFIELRLWTGSVWRWAGCPMKGRTLPLQGKRCSPSLKVLKNRAELHIPVEQKVSDIRKVKERLNMGESICALFCPNQDTLAVCIHMDVQGKILHSKFFKGGVKLRHQKEVLCSKKVNRKIPSPKVRQKIQRIHEAYAHQISRQIVAFAQEVKASVIVVPNYRMTDSSFWMPSRERSCYDWIGRSIMKKTAYKAFQKGILLGMVSFDGVFDVCATCGTWIPCPKVHLKNHLLENKTSWLICPNGHWNTTVWNSAVNVGRNFLKSYKL